MSHNKNDDEDNQPGVGRYLDSIVGTIAIFALIVLCAGTPDLLDAITKRVADGGKPQTTENTR